MVSIISRFLNSIRSRSVTPNIYSGEAKSISVGAEGAPAYICPAQVEPELARKLQHLAWRAHTLLGALDVSRTDMRLDPEGNPRLLEINTLPGLTPGYSDLCLEANAENISYTDLILGDSVPGRGPLGPARASARCLLTRTKRKSSR